MVLFFVYFKLSAVLLSVNDPLAPFENLFCAVFMGGIWDALSRYFLFDSAKPSFRAIVTSRERQTSGKTENGTVQSDHKKEQ